MSRADEQAFPVAGMQAPNDNFIWPTSGLTIREHFAALALQGLCANSEYVSAYCSAEEADALGRDAVLLADALIAELTKPWQP